MKLLIPELRASLPPLYSQENVPDPVVHAKFFTPDSNWTWYVTEGQAEDHDFRFFGYVCGMEEEWGYFVLSELESVRGPLGLEIERDLYFEPGPFTQVRGGSAATVVDEARGSRRVVEVIRERSTRYTKESEMIFIVVAYEVTELTRIVEADTVEEAIALAYHGSATNWTEWSETTLGTNGIEVVFAECGESVYDAGTRASMPTEDFEGAWQCPNDRSHRG